MVDRVARHFRGAEMDSYEGQIDASTKSFKISEILARCTLNTNKSTVANSSPTPKISLRTKQNPKTIIILINC